MNESVTFYLVSLPFFCISNGLSSLFPEDTNMDSLPGSEHSCHMSHTSSPAGSVDNLSAAPPTRHLDFPPHHGASSQPGNPSDVNLNRDSPAHADKHYAMHLHHHPSHDARRPDNRLVVNMDTEAAAAAQRASQGGQSSAPSCRKGPGSADPLANPIERFPKDQPLPSAFRLQQAYDNQGVSQAEKKRISRLSQCCPVEELARQKEGGGGVEILPQTDPAKLAKLQQFDRMNLGGGIEEKEPNTLRSDPKKLAQLKQFDAQAHLPTQENVSGSPDEAAFCEGSSLACDPRKLAQLRQFDEGNMKASNIVEQSQREEVDALASDPRKLAALTLFDAAQNERSVGTNPSARHGEESAAGQNKVTNNEFENTSLVSQTDYVVVTSQREALEACNSLLHQQGQVAAQQLNLSQSSVNDSEARADSFPETYPQDFSADGSPVPGHHQDSACTPTAGTLAPKEKLLLRQKEFFEMYSRLAETVDDPDDEDEDFAGEEEGSDDNVAAEENCNEGEGHGGTGPSAVDRGCSLPVQEQIAAPAVSAHCHPVPSEQDESMLNYFKQREQHYEKTFKKPAQAFQC